MMPNFCKKCMATLDPNSNVCPSCGAATKRTDESGQLISPQPMSRFCSACGARLTGAANFCSECGAAGRSKSTSTPVSASTGPITDKSVAIGCIVGLVVFVVFYSLIGSTEEHGGRVRMHVLAWLAYRLGGASLLSAIVGGIAGFFAWMWARDKQR